MAIKFLSGLNLSDVTAGSILKLDSNGKIVAATAGTDYITSNIWSTASSDNIYYNSGGVRIGTYQSSVDAAAKLHVFDYQTTDPKLLIEDGNTGDASMQFKISTQQYTMGIDNSNSDKFVLAASSALGTTNALEVATTGKITVPQPTAQGAVRLEMGGYNRLRFNGAIDLLGYTSDHLWVIGNSTTNTINLSSDWDWDKQIAISYTPGTVGAAGGQMILGQTEKNNTNWTHGITSLYTNGSERVRINSSGNVGIGTTSPGFKLQVGTPAVVSGSDYSWSFDLTRANSTSRGFSIGQADGGGVVVMGGHNTDMAFGHTFGTDTNGNPLFYETMRIQHVDQAVGNVGIGTTSPSRKLTISDGGGGTDPTDSRTKLYIDADTETYITLNAPANSFEGIRMAANGTNKAAFEYWDNTAQGQKIWISAIGAYPISLATNNTERLRIDASGNVGIGTTTFPTTAIGERELLVQGAIASKPAGVDDYYSYLKSNWSDDGAFELGIQGADTNHKLITTSNYFYGTQLNFHTSDQKRMVIDTNGNVGIGTTSPFGRLNVSRAGINEGAISFDDQANNAHLVLAGTDALVRMQLGTYNNGSYGAWIQGSYDNGGVNYGTEPLILNPQGGNVGIGTTSPGSKLSVRATTATHQLVSINRANSDTAALYLGNNSSNDAIISGNNAPISLGKDVSGTYTEYVNIATDGELKFSAYGAGILKTNASGIVSLDTNTYLTSVSVDWSDIASINGTININSTTQIGQGDTETLVSFQNSGTERASFEVDDSANSYFVATGFKTSTASTGFLKADGTVDTGDFFGGAYSDLTGTPTLGTMAAASTGDYKTSDQTETYVATELASYTLTSALGTAATTASTDYATSAQGTTADNALPKAGGTMTGKLKIDTRLQIGDDTSSSVDYIYDGYLDANSAYFHQPKVIIRSDSSAAGGIDEAPVALALFNRNGANNTWVKMSFASREVSGGGNTVSIAGIAAQKTTGTSGSWASGKLHLWTKNGADFVENMTLRPNGNVGVGIDNPGYKLDVDGTIRSGTGYKTSINGDGSGAVVLFGSATDIDALGVIGAYSSKFNISSGNGDMSFQFNSTERMLLASNGNLKLNAYTAGLLKTDANGNVSLDTSSYQPAGTYADGTTYQTYGTGNNGWLMPDYNNNTSNFMRMYYDDGSREFRMYSNHGVASGEAKIALYDGGVFNTISSTNIAEFKTAYGWGNHASAGYASTTSLTTGLAGKADTSHKYHSFSNGQQYYDGYGQSNYLRLFTENAVFDNFRFRSYSNVEVSADGVNWNASSLNLNNLFDGREETGVNITHETKKLRFEINRSSGWPTTALFVIQSTWSNTTSHTGQVTLETWDGSQWIQRDQWTYSSFQRGYNLHTTTQVHNGQNNMRVTILMDWTDATHNYLPLRRILLLSNYSGTTYDMKPFTWNYGRDVTFANNIYTTGGNSTEWDTAYGWGNHGSAGYLTTASAATTYAPLASPALTGTPTAPTAAATTNTTQIATTAFVQTAVSNLVDSAPGTLDTLNELAAALGDDANFSTTITNSIATKLPLSGGTITGDLQVNGKITQAGVVDKEEWGRSYVTNTNAIQEILNSDGNPLRDGGAYRVVGHIDGTGTDQASTAVFWNQNGTWYVNVTGQSGTSSNHIQFLINGGKPSVKTYHQNNYTVQVYHERISLEEGTGTDNARYYFGTDSYMSDVAGTLKFQGTHNVWHSGVFANNSTNWNTAYTYSQVGHLPLAGGTLTGTLTGTYGIFGNQLYVNQGANLTSQALQVNGFIDITDITGTALRWFDGTTFRGGLGTNDWALSGSANDLGMYVAGNNSFFVHTNNAATAEFNSAGLSVTGKTTSTEQISVNNRTAISVAHWAGSGSTTGAIKITIPGSHSSNWSMLVLRITAYEYNSTNHTIYYVSGHDWTSGWYNNGVTKMGDSNKDIKLGWDSNKDYVLLGGVSDTWSYGHVTVDVMAHPSFYNGNMDITSGWDVRQTTDLTGINITAVTNRKVLTSADNVNADTVDGLHASSFVRSDTSDEMSGTLTFRNNVSGDNEIIRDINFSSSAVNGSDDRAALVRGWTEGGTSTTRGGKLSFYTRTSGTNNFTHSFINQYGDFYAANDIYANSNKVATETFVTTNYKTSDDTETYVGQELTGYTPTSSFGTAAFTASTDYLGATAKAADSNLLDGIDSTGFVKQLGITTDPNFQTPSSRRLDPNASNPTNDYYAVTTFGNGSNVTGQLATHFQTGQLYSRGYNNSWSAWKKYATETFASAEASAVQDNLDTLAGSLGTLAYSSATIPTNNNELTNGAGYITGYTETDTLASVTGRGASTTTSLSIRNLTSRTIVPETNIAYDLGTPEARWQIVFCQTLDSAGQHESQLQNPEGEKSIGDYATGTVLVWKGGKNIPCTEAADHMRMGIAVNGIDSPLVQGAEPVLVTGSVNEGDYLVTSSVEGHAKAITPQFMRQHMLFDCVIGKALESGEGDSHLIKTWINI